MIMDGNKRWADLYGVSLTQGYQQGLNKLKEIYPDASHICYAYRIINKNTI